MDLTNLWQEHRTFILSATAGLLVFFVGQGVISACYPVDDLKRTADRLSASLRRAETPSTAELNRVRALQEELNACCESALKRIAFTPDPKYLLNGTEKPDIQYDRLYNEARDTLVEGAKTLNITVDGSLGMPELSPTRTQDIQQALTALDMVTRVVVLALRSQVTRIDSISMVPDAGRRKERFFQEQRVRFRIVASPEAIGEFLRAFSREECFLAFDEAQFQMIDEEGAAVQADFTLSALTVIQEDPEA